MNPKKHLSFGSLRKGLSSLFCAFPDTRESAKTDYSIHDAMMSGFACMYFQDPSLLQFQERLKEIEERHNLQTLFGVNDIPSQTQLRDIVDIASGNNASGYAASNPLNARRNPQYRWKHETRL